LTCFAALVQHLLPHAEPPQPPTHLPAAFVATAALDTRVAQPTTESHVPTATAFSSVSSSASLDCSVSAASATASLFPDIPAGSASSSVDAVGAHAAAAAAHTASIQITASTDTVDIELRPWHEYQAWQQTQLAHLATLTPAELLLPAVWTDLAQRFRLPTATHLVRFIAVDTGHLGVCVYICVHMCVYLCMCMCMCRLSVACPPCQVCTLFSTVWVPMAMVFAIGCRHLSRDWIRRSFHYPQHRHRHRHRLVARCRRVSRPHQLTRWCLPLPPPPPPPLLRQRIVQWHC
jgi:hypothetical protein